MSSLSPVSSSSNTSQLHFLDPKERPEDLQEIIEDSFNSLSRDVKSSWGLFNGSEAYGICRVKEQEMFKKIIQENAASGQKEFYALDIGAGDFQWGMDMAKYLNEQTDLPAGIQINIISVRGERNPGERIIENGRCKIYNFGAFKVEEIIEAFKKEGLDLENKIDLAVSNWCFRHLADPVGTFVQSYNLLRPKTGTILLNGFLFLLGEQSLREEPEFERNMIQLFLDTTAPFITKYNGNCRSLNDYMLRRSSEAPLHLPMRYQGCERLPHGYQVGSSTITRFEAESQDNYKDAQIPYSWERNDLHGDKEIYEWLKTNHLLWEPSSEWKPVFERDSELGSPALHKAILANDVDGVRECLEKGAKINESDSSGNTPLHLAIQQKNKAIFTLLLQKGADLTLKNGKKLAALHQAAMDDQEGYFIQALIAAGANIYKGPLRRFSYKETPLDFAITAKNLKAIEMLIQAGAALTKDNTKELQKPEFEAIQKLGVLPSSSDDKK